MRRHEIILFTVGALLLAVSAAGDWLVTRDGNRIETSGPWEVKGRQVIFTRPDSSLASLRLADVDLEASDAATAESHAPPPQPAEPEAAPEPRKSVLSLTNEDLRPPGSDPDEDPDADEADEADETEDDEAEPEEEAASNEPVRLVSWDSSESDDIGGLELTGTVRNSGGGVAAAVRVTVTVLDDEAEPYVSQAFLQRSSLAPGGSSTFRVLLPGIFSLPEDPTFEIKSEGLSVQGPAGGGDSGGEDADRGSEAGGRGEPSLR